jgi:hypothetical protein
MKENEITLTNTHFCLYDFKHFLFQFVCRYLFYILVISPYNQPKTFLGRYSVVMSLHYGAKKFFFIDSQCINYLLAHLPKMDLGNYHNLVHVCPYWYYSKPSVARGSYYTNKVRRAMNNV